ncbi:ParB/RepB/Spo0J family partition protein [Desulfococcus multivorans]|uniref:ParB-like partition protein n=1 Tax=Desulfococcus multivorans DSM 2059 TaxID=1121405 RepID=S7TNX5_DESML|nr:ParB/RepB/Spo0J family partition protein [Desulfococcus multivorans]AOY57834.1 ParB: predicted chromosome partitioning protein [Desulfococcus multivorans]AQV02888.2 chromosome partitioning protein ParB [Desulfococcus multivorans]EPR38917.1 parB-like partition protein [Desulfococcus multivorans DSM 2059]SJZ67385.1 chromosome partitioning protein, ParB family [Desulfococcus multivorans DSM 2059]
MVENGDVLGDKSEGQSETSSKKRKKMALGKGLGALIPKMEASSPPSVDGKYFKCDLHRILPNRYQPRRRFSEEDLRELSASIKEQGIIQPLVVRESGGGYELIAGERRFRAAKMAGLAQVPVVVKSLPSEGLLEMSLVENIQRENLNPIEESDAYHRLMTEFGLNQEQVAVRVGKSRPAVANFLRLRQLPEEIRSAMVEGRFSMGHAKAVLGLDNPAHQRDIFQLVITKDLSVRETEILVNRLKAVQKDPESPEPSSEDIYFASVAEDLSRRLGTKVQIKRRGRRGKMMIEFYTDEDLDRLLEIFGGD